MVFDPTSARAHTDKQRVTAMYDSDIGDTTAGGSTSIKPVIDNVRRFRGVVADIAARDATASLANNDWVVVADNGTGSPEPYMYYTSGTLWKSMVGASGGSGFTETAATVADAKALTGLASGNMVLVVGVGFGFFSATQDHPADDETCINVTTGGQIVMEMMHPNAMLAYLAPEFTYTDERLNDLGTASRLRVASLTQDVVEQFGVVAMESISTVDVVFAEPFDANPVVQLTPYRAGGTADYSAHISALSATQMTIRLYNNTGAVSSPGFAVHWTAKGVLAV